MFLDFISGMAKVETRYESATNLAKYLGCSYLIILTKDQEIDTLLPAPGFPSTLPIDHRWEKLLFDVTKTPIVTSMLPFPSKNQDLCATALSGPEESVAILLGGHPQTEQLQGLQAALPILTALFMQEQQRAVAEAIATVAERSAMKSQRLATTIDAMRLKLRDALVSQDKDKKAIEELLNKKDEFLNIASHELKTPLTSIKAFNQIMQRTRDTEKIHGFVLRSAEQISRLERLIGDLLDVTKIHQGQLNYTYKHFDFKALLLETIETVQYLTRSHEIVLVNAPAFTYYGDYFRLEQVLTNFLNNAIKYSPGGKKVLVDCQLQADHVVVSIQDFGIGIPPEQSARLDERYFRGDKLDMRFEGLGLGLFITSEILKRHDGAFWVESKLGEGSTFYFKLPLDPAR
jgi:signal transduction histidine kinase